MYQLLYSQISDLTLMILKLGNYYRTKNCCYSVIFSVRCYNQVFAANTLIINKKPDNCCVSLYEDEKNVSFLISYA